MTPKPRPKKHDHHKSGVALFNVKIEWCQICGAWRYVDFINETWYEPTSLRVGGR